MAPNLGPEEHHCTRRTGLSTHLDHHDQWAKHWSSKNRHGNPTMRQIRGNSSVMQERK
ncbi:hypothetical protein ACRRTK_003656 [Alexandromys fortis]